MQQIQRRAATLCTLALLAACADAPTAPQPLLAEKGGSTPSAFDSQTTQGCVVDGVCYLPPVTGGGSTCDPYLQLDWNCDDGGGDCMTGEPGGEADTAYGLAGCQSPGPGGGGSVDGPDPQPSDTCQTGQPALDNPAIKEALDALWTSSNPDAPQAQRLEQAGWIIQRADGTYFMAKFEVTAQGPCAINGSLLAPPGAVAWVHTHPFSRGEVQVSCGALKQPDPHAPGGFRDLIGPDGNPVYPTYDNKPSFPDYDLMLSINLPRSELGQGLLAGVVIDADQMTVYTESRDEAPNVLPRCGY